MTENYRSRVYEKLRQGIESRGYSLGERLSKSKGASGSLVYKGEKDGKPVALKVGSYGLLDSYEGDEVEKLEDFRRREKEVLQLAGNHPNIPGYVDSFTIEGNDFYPEPISVLAMEYLDLPSVAERILKKERVTEEEAKILLRDGISALNHLHTGLPYQVLHRDVKPANVLLNHSKAYLIDFDIVKQGDDDATSKTNIDTAGYYPIDAFRGHPNESHDLVALGNVAIAGISGKKITDVRTEQDRFQLDEVSTDRLLVSAPYREFLGKMIAPSGVRFKTAREALSDLERRMGTSLPVAVERTPMDMTSEEAIENFRRGVRGLRKMEEEEARSSLDKKSGVYVEPYHRDSKGRTTMGLMRDGELVATFAERKDAYETLKEISDPKSWSKDSSSVGIARDLFGKHKDDVRETKEEISGQLVSAYIEYLSQNGHPVLQPFASDERTLESMVTERKPRDSDPEFKTNIRHLIDEYLYNKAKQEYKQQRSDLCKVLGVERQPERSGFYISTEVGSSIGATPGVIISVLKMADPNSSLPEIFLPLFGLAALGGIGGSIVGRYFTNKQLIKRARQLDEWKREARGSRLEDKIDDVQLSQDEKNKIMGIAGPVSFATASALVLGTLNFLGNYTDNGLIKALGAIGVGVASSLTLLKSSYNVLKNRRLKEKRMERGLEEKVGNVQLTSNEESNIFLQSAGGSFLSMFGAIGAYVKYLGPEPISVPEALIGGVLGLGTLGGVSHLLEKFLTNRKLKQKRIAAEKKANLPELPRKRDGSLNYDASTYSKDFEEKIDSKKFVKNIIMPVVESLEKEKQKNLPIEKTKNSIIEMGDTIKIKGRRKDF